MKPRKQAENGRRGGKGRRTKPPKRSPARRKEREDADLMTRTTIARKARLDRDTVRRYLALDGAPKPKRKGLFSFKAVMAWVEKNAPRLATSTDEMREIRQAMLRMEKEDMEIDLAVKRGRYVDKALIAPTIAAFMSALTEDLQSKFELELPTKYDGKTAAERLQLNAEAVDWVLTRLKSGAAPISKAP